MSAFEHVTERIVAGEDVTTDDLLQAEAAERLAGLRDHATQVRQAREAAAAEQARQAAFLERHEVAAKRAAVELRGALVELRAAAARWQAATTSYQAVHNEALGELRANSVNDPRVRTDPLVAGSPMVFRNVVDVLLGRNSFRNEEGEEVDQWLERRLAERHA